MRILYYLPLFFFLLSCNSNSKSSCDTFEEMSDSETIDTAAWKKLPEGLQASFGTTDIRYGKTQAPSLEGVSSWQGIAWKGERLSAQLVLWTTEDVDAVSFRFADFKSVATNLPASIAKARFVRYVMTDVFGKGCDRRAPEDYPAHLSADMLDNLTCFNIPACTVRPVWISIDIPVEAAAGIYEGDLTLLVGGKKTKEFKLELEVLNKTLPPPAEWVFHLDLWQHPTAVARYHNVPLWSTAHYNYLRPLMKMLADAGQKVITTTLNKDPWNGQCYDRYAPMIQWTKKKDGNWMYDYTEFDRWVTFMMDLGIKKMINCYSMVPWNNELEYWDEQMKQTITVQAVPGTPVFREIWTPFLLDFTKHLEVKGWLDITNIAMDERSPEMMKATISLLQEIAPGLGISLADNHKSYKEYPFIKDLCVGYGALVEEADLKYRKENGMVTTYYVCCSSAFPNQFTFSLPSEAVFTAWYAAAAGFDGFLRWAYNSWVGNPLTDSRFRTWPAGDTYMVYPDARSSIRFERLREGIQDVEKIRVLRRDLMTSGLPKDQEKLAQLEAAISTFILPESQTKDACAQVIETAKKVLNEMSK